MFIHQQAGAQPEGETQQTQRLPTLPQLAWVNQAHLPQFTCPHKWEQGSWLCAPWGEWKGQKVIGIQGGEIGALHLAWGAGSPLHLAG